METLSAPIIMHSNVLESKCLQLDAGMIHTYPLVTKRKDPTKQNHIKKHHQKRQGTASCGRLKKPSLARNQNGP